MSIIITPKEVNGKRIDANVRYPSKQTDLTFFEGVEELSYKRDLPKAVKGLFYAVIFKSDRVVLCRDVLGSKPLYYDKDLRISSFKKYVGDAESVSPGEIIEIGYDGDILRRDFYDFDDVFVRRDVDLKEAEEIIIRALESLKLRNACIGFSGGVDSSLLAGIYDVQLVSVTASKREKEKIEEAAKSLGKDVEIFEFKEKDVQACVRDVVYAIETTNPLQVSIAIPIHLAMKFAKSLGYSEIIFGQGADELFGGYKRYENLVGESLRKAIEEDIRNIGENNLVRDTKLAYFNEIKLIAPYLHWDIIEVALAIPTNLKIYREGGKVIRKFFLREVAKRLIPESIAYQEKKAIQYSTRAYKILDKIARRNGKTLKDYLKGLEWR